ncbi:MAG: hypothetical protein KGM44_01915 [bacterium]|nr:hypothetical protein [bacterium]
MESFVKITLIVAAVIVALVVLAFLVKVVIVAAILAAIIVGVAYTLRVVRGRQQSRPPAP